MEYGELVLAGVEVGGELDLDRGVHAGAAESEQALEDGGEWEGVGLENVGEGNDADAGAANTVIEGLVIW